MTGRIARVAVAALGLTFLLGAGPCASNAPSDPGTTTGNNGQTGGGSGCTPACGACELCAPLGNGKSACVPKCRSCQQCVNGTCESTCTGACDVCTDAGCVSSCGACGTCDAASKTCKSNCSACEECIGGMCQSTCPDCGACDNGTCRPCGQQPCEQCTGGRCIGCTSCETCDGATNSCKTSCAGGQTCCNGECLAGCAQCDHATGAPKPGTGDALCTNASDVCCGKSCVDTATDPANCGACNQACPGTQNCCASACVDTDSDPNNCGGCGNTCAAGGTCCAGQCYAPGGGGASCGVHGTMTLVYRMAGADWQTATATVTLVFQPALGGGAYEVYSMKGTVSVGTLNMDSATCTFADTQKTLQPSTNPMGWLVIDPVAHKYGISLSAVWNSTETCVSKVDGLSSTQAGAVALPFTTFSTQLCLMTPGSSNNQFYAAAANLANTGPDTFSGTWEMPFCDPITIYGSWTLGR